MNDLHEVTKRAARILKLGRTPQLKIQRRRRGRAYPESGWFSVPQWATNAHPSFATAYVIHELCHFHLSKYSSGKVVWVLRGHGKTFRRIELQTAERFGLRLSYRGTAYLDHIRDLHSGEVLCDGYGRPIIDFQI